MLKENDATETGLSQEERQRILDMVENEPEVLDVNIIEYCNY